MFSAETIINRASFCASAAATTSAAPLPQLVAQPPAVVLLLLRHAVVRVHLQNVCELGVVEPPGVLLRPERHHAARAEPRDHLCQRRLCRLSGTSDAGPAAALHLALRRPEELVARYLSLYMEHVDA
ncbi:hypothetical protein CTA1_5507 [Colletotrichum tanaceti]|uniref:Uncharacterized protein n=1 Tax=Colletotrichum tanaceti TaxID=1306861 RepID=A0A4U6XD47_9PEZI|nr:hypothetical protein CTA1_5507 [Colletotrichum tanaceti]